LGLNSAVFSLTVIGGVLLGLAAITVLTGSSFGIWFMLLFAFCLITPLVFIYLYMARGLKISAVLKWKEESKGVMRLSIGLVHIILGWLVLLLLNGTLGSVL
jgi:cytochrome c biogenesis protein CcdA